MRLVKAVPLTVALAILTMLATGALSQPASAAVSFDFFYSNLSPHGSWLVSAQYGRVWQPYEARPGWNPYYDGHWAYTDLGWTWVSDYEWGATPYHYGTWVEDPQAGWVWMPGYVWGPSWVVFSSGPDYIGWAPVPPNYSLSVSIGPRDVRPSHFVFVTSGNFMAPRVRACALPPSRTTVIVNRTKIVNNITVQNNVVVNRGPDVRIVERACGRHVRATPIEQVQQVSRGPRFSREEIRVDSRRSRSDLRVAEVRSADAPLPAQPIGRREDRRDGRRDDRTVDRVDRRDDRVRTTTDPTTTSRGVMTDQPVDPRVHHMEPSNAAVSAPSGNSHETGRRNGQTSQAPTGADQTGKKPAGKGHPGPAKEKDKDNGQGPAKQRR